MPVEAEIKLLKERIPNRDLMKPYEIDNVVLLMSCLQFSHLFAVARPAPIRLTSPSRGHDSNTYKIMWKKPGTGGKPIKEYEIRYKKVCRIETDGRV